MIHRMLTVFIGCLALSAWDVRAATCTGEQIIRMMEFGFSKNEVLTLCGSQPGSAAAPEALSLASIVGVWEGHRKDGIALRIEYSPEGKFRIQFIDPTPNQVREVWGSVQVTALGPGKGVFQTKPEGWSPKEAELPYTSGMVSAPFTMPDNDTIETNAWTVKRVRQ